jgi:hypothetical protein
MITDIKKLNKQELLLWLREEAGVNHPSWFGEGLFVGGLEIQQIPEEYVEYLWFLKTNKFNNYLNIGIGNGGSFLVETLIQDSLKMSIGVDNVSYWREEQLASITQKVDWLKTNTNTHVDFVNTDSTTWFSYTDAKFDIIFIDGDHSYEGVKEDFVNSLKVLKEEGYIVLHDIASTGCPGVVKLWSEINNKRCLEFVNNNTCGIGIYKNL